MIIRYIHNCGKSQIYFQKSHYKKEVMGTELPVINRKLGMNRFQYKYTWEYTGYKILISVHFYKKEIIAW